MITFVSKRMGCGIQGLGFYEQGSRQKNGIILLIVIQRNACSEAQWPKKVTAIPVPAIRLYISSAETVLMVPYSSGCR